VLVLAPHPDDEVVGCGGTAHLLAQAGARVAVVVMARGDGGIDPSGAAVDVSRRREESRACCQALGLEAPLFLGLRSDVIRADPVAAGAALARALGARRADELLVPSPLERHATHRACLLGALSSGVGRAGARWWGWGAWDALPAWDDVWEVDVAAARVAKTHGIRAHVSQDRPRGLAAASLARDASQAAFSRLSGPEPRRAVERLMDLSALARRTEGLTELAALTRAVAGWTAERSAAWARQLWADREAAAPAAGKTSGSSPA